MSLNTGVRVSSQLDLGDAPLAGILWKLCCVSLCILLDGTEFQFVPLLMITLISY